MKWTISPGGLGEGLKEMDPARYLPRHFFAASAKARRMLPPFLPRSSEPMHLLNLDDFFTNLKGAATDTFSPPIDLLDDIWIPLPDNSLRNYIKGGLKPLNYSASRSRTLRENNRRLFRMLLRSTSSAGQSAWSMTKKSS